MAIFGKNGLYNSSYSYESYNVEPTAEGMAAITFEGYQSISKLISGLYAADSIIENAVFEGSIGDPEIAMEGTLREFFANAKEKFKKWWAKVKEWFKRAIQNIKIAFTSKAKFVEKWKSVIKKNASNKAIFRGSVIGDMKVPKVPTHNGDAITAASGIVRKEIGDMSLNEFTKEDASAVSVDDLVKKISSKLGVPNSVESIAELKEEMNKLVFDDDNMTDVMNVGIDAMLDFCLNVNKITKSINEQEKASDKAFKDAIKVCEDAQKAITGDSDDDKKNKSGWGYKIKTYENGIAIINALSSTLTEIIKKVNDKYIVVLKKVAMLKPDKKSTKESYGDSIFESAMRMI